MSEVAPRLSLRRVGAMVAVIGTVITIALHLTFGLNAGALWRDEVNSLNIATMSSFSELWSYLTFDSFPALFFVLLRGFAGLPAATSDIGLRIFGVVIGLLIIGAVWLNARWLRFGFPLISLALIGFNPMVIRYGDSIRAYGLGMLLLLLSMGAIWRLVEKGSVGRLLFALTTAVLSVQCLYYNSFLLFAICVGAAAVSWSRHEYQRVFVILGIGGIAALSMLIYLPVIEKVKATQFLWKGNFTVEKFWIKLSGTLGSPLASFAWLWVVLFVVAVAAASWYLSRQAETEEASAAKGPLLFGALTLFIGSAAYFGFLFHLSYETQPWYYVVYVAFAATSLESVFASLPGRQWAFRSAFGILCIGLSWEPAWAASKIRQTNVDFIADRLDSLASERDLILINTSNYGISLSRYYHGQVKWMSVPPVSDLRFHRCDLVKLDMMSDRPLGSVIQKVVRTLESGHTVWLVGGVNFVPPKTLPLALAPGFDGPDGWVGGDFYRSWSEQIGFLLQTRARLMSRVPVSPRHGQLVSHYENLPLTAFSGWRQL